jgi:hypothetical protein
VVCFAFSLPPTAFVRQMNRAVAQTVQETALQEGLHPLLIWVKDLMDVIVQRFFGQPKLEFVWKQEKDVDPQIQAQIHDIYLRNGTLSVDEVREELGREPIGMKNAVYGAQGVTLVEDLINPPPPLALPAPAQIPGGEAPPVGTQKAFFAEIISKAYKLGML